VTSGSGGNLRVQLCSELRIGLGDLAEHPLPEQGEGCSVRIRGRSGFAVVVEGEAGRALDFGEGVAGGDGLQPKAPQPTVESELGEARQQGMPPPLEIMSQDRP